MGFDSRTFMKLDAVAYIVVFLVIVVAAALWRVLGLPH